MLKANENSNMEENSTPYYGQQSPLKTMMLRIWFGVTFLALLVAFIFGLVKAKDDPVMYLLVVNLLVSGVIGTTIAWWYHKGYIKSQSLIFVLFVGVCVVFQAIVSDIYLSNNPSSSSDDTDHTRPLVNITTSILSSSSVKPS